MVGVETQAAYFDATVVLEAGDGRLPTPPGGRASVPQGFAEDGPVASCRRQGQLGPAFAALFGVPRRMRQLQFTFQQGERFLDPGPRVLLDKCCSELRESCGLTEMLIEMISYF